MRPTWTLAGHLQAVRFGLASGGVCPAAASPRRWCALTAPFHPCHPPFTWDGGFGGMFLWHFPAGFPGSISRPPCPRCPDFPQGQCPRSYSTCAFNGSEGPATAKVRPPFLAATQERLGPAAACTAALMDLGRDGDTRFHQATARQAHARLTPLQSAPEVDDDGVEQWRRRARRRDLHGRVGPAQFRARGKRRSSQASRTTVLT